MAGLVLHISLHHEVENLERIYSLADLSCPKAAQAEPENFDAWRLYGDAENLKASTLEKAGHPGAEHYRRASEHLGRAIELNGEDTGVLFSAGSIHSNMSHFAWLSGRDPRPDAEKASLYFQRAKSKDPESAANALGNILRVVTAYQIQEGLDADESSKQGVAYCLESLRLDPKGIDLGNLSKSLGLRRNILLESGRNPYREIEHALSRIQALPPELPHRQETLKTLKSWLDSATVPSSVDPDPTPLPKTTSTDLKD